MAGSRLEKLGTIFSRVTALLRTGAMSRDDKPIWYDVYYVFPPKTEPSYASRRPLPEIREILYPEDSIRAKFHRKMQKKLPMDDLLREPTTDLTCRAIDITYDLMRKNQSLSEDQAIDKVIEIFKREGLVWNERAARPRRNREIENVEAQSEELETDTSELKSLKRVKDDGETIKTISDKHVDVSKFLKE